MAPGAEASETPAQVILNVSLRFVGTDALSDHAAMPVSTGLDHLWVHLLLRERTHGPSLLVPTITEPSYVAFSAPDGYRRTFNLPTIIDLQVSPTYPWYAVSADLMAPAAGEWNVNLHGVGHNVNVDVWVEAHFP